MTNTTTETAAARIKRHGWETHFLDDGFGPSGWWACRGLWRDPDRETGLFETEDAAARAALAEYPADFSD